MMEKRKHVRELAPFASSEDLSDERESPLDENKQKGKLSDINEEIVKKSSKNDVNEVNVKPCIMVSQSSQQEDNYRGNELCSGNRKGPKLQRAFDKKIATELQSKADELPFQNLEIAERNKRKISQIVCPLQLSDIHIDDLCKDSTYSDIGLLSISGRTSRVSSIGSAASGGSGISSCSGVSHHSATSHLSTTSNLSRGSSPNRVSVETSFCGSKPVHTASLDVDDTTKGVDLDKLQQKTDVDANKKQDEVKIVNRQLFSSEAHSNKHSKHHHKRKQPAVENPKTQTFISLHSDEEDESIVSSSVKSKPIETVKETYVSKQAIDPQTQIFIPLKGSLNLEDEYSVNSNNPKKLKPFTNTTLVNFIKKYEDRKDLHCSSTRKENNLVETEDYQSKEDINKELQIFISLRDDDDDVPDGKNCVEMKTPTTVIQKVTDNKPNLDKQNSIARVAIPVQFDRSVSPTEANFSQNILSTQDLPKYLMKDDGTTLYIPLHGSNELSSLSEQFSNHLAVGNLNSKSRSEECNLAVSPNLDRHLGLGYRNQSPRSTKSMTQLMNIDRSRTPSPNSTMYINYGKDSKNKSNIQYLHCQCSESTKEIHNIGKSKSRSGSIISLFATLFKKSGSTKQKNSTKEDFHERPALFSSCDHIKSKPRHMEPTTIIIPLHSPDDVLNSTTFYKTDENMTEHINLFTSSINAMISSDNIDMSPTKSTTAEMKYSPLQTKGEEVSIKDKVISNDNDDVIPSCSIVRAEILANTSDTSIDDVQCHQVVQCEVTVHVEETSAKEEKRRKKLVKSKTVESTDSYMQAEHGQDFVKTYANSNANSLINNQMLESSLILAKNTKAEEEEAADAPTDSEKHFVSSPENEEECKTLVNQDESFEELPYIPTTLPLERPVALPIVPIKERVCAEMKTCGVDRPRSGTLVNPALLEAYVTSLPATSTTTECSSIEKLHITLPRTIAAPDSPRRNRSLTKASTGSRNVSSHLHHHSISTATPTECGSSSPPLTLQKYSMPWISFNDSRCHVGQSPKQITIIPHSYTVVEDKEQQHHHHHHFHGGSLENIVFVNPDECCCECHDNQHTLSKNLSNCKSQTMEEECHWHDK